MSDVVIASILPAALNRELERHALRPKVVALADPARPWSVPPEATVYFASPRHWRGAPAEAPDGWPFNLKFVQLNSVGTEVFPRWFFAPGLSVSNARGVAANAVADFVLLAVLAHEKRWFEGLRIHAASEWKPHALGGPCGRTIGIVGYGPIGRAIATRALAFGMKVRVCRRNVAGDDREGVTFHADPVEVIARSDHFVLALPLTGHSRNMVDLDLLRHARHGLHLINVARGEILDQAALVRALAEGWIEAATLDVTTPEPLPEGHELYAHPKVRLFPHISWSSDDFDDRMRQKFFVNLQRHLGGEPVLDAVEPD